MTALMRASWHFNFEATKLLLDDPRVDVNWMDSSGLSVLYRLVAGPQSKNNLKLMELFLAHPRVNMNCKCGPHGTNILYAAAASCNKIEVVKLILAEARFTSANALDDMGRWCCYV